MARTISGSLSAGGIQKIIDELNEYMESLADKNRLFVDKLLDAGITVAEDSIADGTHTMPDRITFSKEFEDAETGVSAILFGVGETFLSEWVSHDGSTYNDEVWPLHMMEFGSAGYALNDGTDFGGKGGKGTFTRSGNDNKYSWYVDVVQGNETVRKYATAIRPTRPMYNAAVEMQRQIYDIAREVFGGA